MLENGYDTDAWCGLYRHKLIWAIASINADADSWCGQSLIYSIPDSIGGSKNGGTRYARSPFGIQIVSFSCSFRQKNLQNNPTLGVGAPREILNPPLERYCDILRSGNAVYIGKETFYNSL